MSCLIRRNFCTTDCQTVKTHVLTPRHRFAFSLFISRTYICISIFADADFPRITQTMAYHCRRQSSCNGNLHSRSHWRKQFCICYDGAVRITFLFLFIPQKAKSRREEQKCSYLKIINGDIIENFHFCYNIMQKIKIKIDKCHLESFFLEEINFGIRIYKSYVSIINLKITSFNHIAFAMKDSMESSCQIVQIENKIGTYLLTNFLLPSL